MQNDCFLSSYSDFCLEDLTLPSPQHTDQSPSLKIDSSSVGGQQDYEEIIFVNETPSITAAATGAPYPPVQRVRRRTTVEERQYLESIYAVNKKPDSDLRKQIAQKLQWPEKSVRIWFQNCRQKEAQRAKEKTKRSPPKSIRTSSIREDSSSLSPPPSSPARKNCLNGQNPQGDGRNMMPNPLSTVSPLLASTTSNSQARYSNPPSSNIRFMSQQQRTPMKRQRVRSVPSVAFKSTPNRERSRSVSNNFGIGLQKQNGGFGNLTANHTNIDPALSNQLIGNILLQDHNDFMRQRAMSVDSAMFPFQVLNGTVISQTQPLAHPVDLNPVSLLDDDLFRQLLVAPTPVTTQIEGEQLLDANSQLLAQANRFASNTDLDQHHNNNAGDDFNELGLLTTIPDAEMESRGNFEENGIVTSLPFNYSFDIPEPTSTGMANDDMDLSFLSAFTDSPAAGSQYQMDSVEDQNAASCFGLDDFNDFDISNQFLNSNMFGGLTVDVPNNELLNPAHSHKRRRLQTSPAALYSEFVKTNEIENDLGLGIDIDNNSQMFEFGNDMVCPSAIEHASPSEMAISDFSSFQNPMPADLDNAADMSLDLNQMFPLGGVAPQYNEMLSFDGGNNEFPSHGTEVDQENPLAAWSLESLRQLMMTESGDVTKEFDAPTAVTAVNRKEDGNKDGTNNQHSLDKNESEISSQQSNTSSNQNNSKLVLPPRRSLSMNDIKPYGVETDNSSNGMLHQQEERMGNGDGPDRTNDSRLERNGDDIDNTADSESNEEELQRKYFLRSRGKAEEVEE